MKRILAILFIYSLLTPLFAADAIRPNILWIVSEDNTTYLGCYGDKTASTPNLDKLAAEGVHFTKCFANAPVCAVSRSSLILGVPAVTTGTQNMRSRYRVPGSLQSYPTLLKKAGYYVSNNAKTDYNNSSFDKNIWDDCNSTANYKNRPPGKPFFAVFNIEFSHEGQIFEQHYPKRYPSPKTAAAGIVIPPYQVNTPEMITDWQRVYDRMTDMDQKVGQLLADLQASGEADNTIVFYCSDHGGITLRSKRYLYDSGTHVPLIVYVPEKWKALSAGIAGSANDRLVQFIDLPKTFLALAQAEIPDAMPGRIFMGEKTQSAPESIFLFSSRFDEAPDMRRAVTDGRWKYIRNYEPDRPRFQMLDFPWGQFGLRSQWREFKAGRTTPAQSAYFQPQPPEELYDTQSDPYETNNLVKAATQTARLAEMRRQLDDKILAARDAGFIPEPLAAKIDADKSATIYGYAQSPARYPLEKILQFANTAAMQDSMNLPALRNNLTNAQPEMRYWACVGLRGLGAAAKPAESDLQKALTDLEASVRITAAVALGNMGHREESLAFLLKEARAATLDAQAAWALDGLRLLDAPEKLQGVTQTEVVRGSVSKLVYDNLAAGGSIHRPPATTTPDE